MLFLIQEKYARCVRFSQATTVVNLSISINISKILAYYSLPHRTPQQKTDILFIFSAVPAERGSADCLRADRLYFSVQCRLP